MQTMQIAAMTQHGVAGWPSLKWGPLTPALNAVCGPPRSGKTTLANLLAHTLFGKATPAGSPIEEPPGEVFVESDRGRYRVRRYRDEQGTRRLTVAGFGGAAVDAGTMSALVGGLSPTVLAPLCAISFRDSPDVAVLLSADFARGFEAIGQATAATGCRRASELAARRDLLAQELETRIADERQISKDLETRCRELERLVRLEQEQARTKEQSLRAAETALAETDARLRYRRLELTVERHAPNGAPCESQASGDDVEGQVQRVRAMLAELAQREAGVRAQLTQIQAVQTSGGNAISETRAWLAVGRQLVADLAGEVARLARASASQQCVCRDAHPRLRPISETIERQLDVLAKLMDEHERVLTASQLQTEADHLGQSQFALRRHLDQLVERCRARQPAEIASDVVPNFSAADAQQLESRRLELEQQRFQLIEQLRAHERTLRDLRAQRETVERQRAALLSARSIEHVQRELASVQQKLEQATSTGGNPGDMIIADENPARASDFLAQLTDGGMVRLALVEQGRRACVVNRAGQTLRVESLTAAERDMVYLSLCLGLLSAARRQGVRLPLVLDEPFERQDARGTAAIAAVLDDFSRQGHQVVVFTGQQAAAERLASVGAAVHDIARLRERKTENTPEPIASLTEVPRPDERPPVDKRSKLNRRKVTRQRRPKVRRLDQPVDDASTTDHSDAA
jgi:energy-coupling factor transporter ATP-binding protein EcfA2